MELYGRVRRAVLVEGRSQRAVAREFGISRDMVRGVLRNALPPGYQRQQAVKWSKLGPWLGIIDAIYNGLWETIMLASFSVVPLGAGEGVKEIIAEVLSIVDGSGLSYQLGPMHTVVEGEPEQVLEVILRCHRRVLELAPRVLTNITLDDRKGATGRLRGKVRDVEQILGKPLSRL